MQKLQKISDAIISLETRGKFDELIVKKKVQINKK